MISLKLAKLKRKEIKSCIKGHTAWSVAVKVVTQPPGEPDFLLDYDSHLERRDLAGRKMAYSKPLLLAQVGGFSHTGFTPQAYLSPRTERTFRVNRDGPL